MSLLKRSIAEFIGTAVLVLFACGTAVTVNGILVGPFAFGLVLFILIFLIGDISGCHVNPAVSLGMLVKGRINAKEFASYVGAQFLGAIVGALLLKLFVGNERAFLGSNNVISNFDADAVAYIVTFLFEAILTFVFVYTVLKATEDGVNKFHASLIIGIALIVVHFFGWNYTGTSVNSARSFGPALIEAIFENTTAIKDVWVFVLAPLCGGGVAGLVYKAMSTKQQEVKDQ